MQALTALTCCGQLLVLDSGSCFAGQRRRAAPMLCPCQPDQALAGRAVQEQLSSTQTPRLLLLLQASGTSCV